MMHGQAACSGQASLRLVENAVERADRERLVCLVLEERHPPSLIVVADDADERRNRAVSMTGPDNGSAISACRSSGSAVTATSGTDMPSV